MAERTKMFAVRVIKLVAYLPKGRVGDVLGRQLLKSGTSIGANYREAVRASSRKHFISIIEITEREADETIYWLDLLIASDLVNAARLQLLRREAEKLLSILAATGRTAKLRSSAIRNPKSAIRNS